MTTNGEQNERGPEVAGRLKGGDVVPVLEPELAALASGLDELARSERASASAGLDNRVFEATWRALGRAPSVDVVARIGPGLRNRRVFTPLRAAAGLALVGAVAMSLVAGRNGAHQLNAGAVQVAVLESEVNEWLALSGGMVGDLAAQINGLDADSASLRERFASGLPASDLFMDEGVF